MKIISLLLVLWFMIGGAWPWLILAFLMWQASGNGSVITWAMLSSKFHNKDHDHGS